MIYVHLGPNDFEQSFDVTHDMTVVQLKQQVLELIGLPTDKQILVYKGIYGATEGPSMMSLRSRSYKIGV